MVDELNFEEEDKCFFHVQGGLLKNNFEKRNVDCTLMDDKNDIYDYIRNFIDSRPYIHNIAFSDGVTLYQLNLFDWVKKEYSQITVNQPLKRGGWRPLCCFWRATRRSYESTL